MSNTERLRWLTQDYETLRRVAYANPKRPDLVPMFFDAYEKRKDLTWDDKSVYHQLKYYHSDDKVTHLKTVGELFLEKKQNYVALACFCEALRLDPSQENIFKKIEELQKLPMVIYPESLKEDTKTVSVVMTSYGRGELIEESVQSVLDQNVDDLELVLVNDAGGAGVKKVVDRLSSPKIKFIDLKENIGMGAARNRGIMEAAGKYIAYLDDDDYMYPDHIEKCLETIKKHEADLVYSNNQFIAGFHRGKKFFPTQELKVYDRDHEKDDIVYYFYFVPSCVLHKKEIVRECGVFYPRLPMTEDWEFWMRIAEKHKIVRSPHYTMQWRQKADNTSQVKKGASYFFGDMFKYYFGYFKGDIALAKYYLFQKNIQKSKEVFGRIMNGYEEYFKAFYAFDDLLDLAVAHKQEKFYKKLARDYARRTPGRLLKKVKSDKNLKPLLATFDLLVTRTLRIKT